MTSTKARTWRFGILGVAFLAALSVSLFSGTDLERSGKGEVAEAPGAVEPQNIQVHNSAMESDQPSVATVSQGEAGPSADRFELNETMALTTSGPSTASMKPKSPFTRRPTSITSR